MSGALNESPSSARLRVSEKELKLLARASYDLCRDMQRSIAEDQGLEERFGRNAGECVAGYEEVLKRLNEFSRLLDEGLEERAEYSLWFVLKAMAVTDKRMLRLRDKMIGFAKGEGRYAKWNYRS